jgi:Type IV secretion system pilin
MANTIKIPIEPNLGDNVQMDAGAYISSIVNFMLIIAAIATFGYLVWGGFNFMTAAGDSKKVEEARHRISNAVLGLTIVALSWAIFLLADNFFGLGVAR